MKRLVTQLIIASFVYIALPGCGSDESSQALNQVGDMEGPADDSARCPPDTEEFSYGANGLLRTDAATGMAVRLLKASDSPPSRGFNDWTIGVTDSNGAPMAKAELNWACAWMPAHNHGSSPKKVTRLGGGQFQLDQQNFAMYGGWQIRFWISPTGDGPVYMPQSGSGIVGGDACRGTGVAPSPTVQFNICVPTSPGD
jgi:hypothetical protein